MHKYLKKKAIRYVENYIPQVAEAVNTSGNNPKPISTLINAAANALSSTQASQTPHAEQHAPISPSQMTQSLYCTPDPSASDANPLGYHSSPTTHLHSSSNYLNSPSYQPNNQSYSASSPHEPTLGHWSHDASPTEPQLGQSFHHSNAAPSAPASQAPAGKPQATLPGSQWKPAPSATHNYSPPIPPPGASVMCSAPIPTRPRHAIYPADLLEQVPVRTHCAHVTLGHTACLEARKGLSRVLDAQASGDLDIFGEQLRQGDVAAVEEDWRREDRIPIFAVTYVQHNPPVGRFKFDEEQWATLQFIVQKLAEAGVTQFRLWLDQCLWLRDASQQAWAHTGLLPYSMWPVICLGKKQAECDKSVESRERLWPFVEEVAGLWGMGVLFGREMRSSDESSGWRWWASCQQRQHLEPEIVMFILLLNIFHGAADELKTGWKEDVIELGEMATANVMSSSEKILVGSDWRQRAMRVEQNSWDVVMGIISLPCKMVSEYADSDCDDEDKSVNIFLDGSRAVVAERWGGLTEWLSGHDVGEVGGWEVKHVYEEMKKLNIRTDVGEFQILSFFHGYYNNYSVVNLLVAMDGPTSNFSRGKVAWTKVMTGIGSCEISASAKSNNYLALGHILSKEMLRRVKVVSMVSTDAAIQWI